MARGEEITRRQMVSAHPASTTSHALRGIPGAVTRGQGRAARRNERDERDSGHDTDDAGQDGRPGEKSAHAPARRGFLAGGW